MLDVRRVPDYAFGFAFSLVPWRQQATARLRGIEGGGCLYSKRRFLILFLSWQELTGVWASVRCRSPRAWRRGTQGRHPCFLQAAVLDRRGGHPWSSDLHAQSQPTCFAPAQRASTLRAGSGPWLRSRRRRVTRSPHLVAKLVGGPRVRIDAAIHQRAVERAARPLAFWSMWLARSPPSVLQHVCAVLRVSCESLSVCGLALGVTSTQSRSSCSKSPASTFEPDDRRARRRSCGDGEGHDSIGAGERSVRRQDRHLGLGAALVGVGGQFALHCVHEPIQKPVRFLSVDHRLAA